MRILTTPILITIFSFLINSFLVAGSTVKETSNEIVFQSINKNIQDELLAKFYEDINGAKSAEKVLKHYYYNQISLKDGLPSSIRCILRDNEGYIWIGTSFGLVRFDGSNLVYYKNEFANIYSLPGDEVNNLFEDSLGCLWVSTNKGLARLDKNERKFIRYQYNGQPLMVDTISEIKDEVLFGGVDALFSLDREELRKDVQKQKKHYIKQESLKDIKKLSENNTVYPAHLKVKCVFDKAYNYQINSITGLSDSTLLLSSKWSGLLLCNKNTGTIARPKVRLDNKIMVVFEDSEGAIWLSAYNDGLRKYDKKGNLKEHYTSENSGLTNDIILSIIEKDNKLWIGTDGGGICLLNLKNKYFETIDKTHFDEGYSYMINSVRCLYNDSRNNVWVGTIRHGLVDIREVSMHTYEGGFSEHNNLSCGTVLSLYQQTPRRVFVGTDGGGINLLNPETGKFLHFKTFNKDKVVSICALPSADLYKGQSSGKLKDGKSCAGNTEDYARCHSSRKNYYSGNPNEKLLVSIFSKGVYVFDPKTDSAYPLTKVNERLSVYLCRLGKSVRLLRISPYEVLVLGRRMYKYDIRTKEYTLVKEENCNLLNTPMCAGIEGDNVYIYDLSSIYKYSISENVVRKIYMAPYGVKINSASYDGKDCFYLGTEIGLLRYNYTEYKKNLESITAKDKKVKYKEEVINFDMVSNVSLVLCDGPERVWFGTNDMLMVWLPKDRRVVLYGESDGVLKNEYISNASLAGIDGRIFLGGVVGLTQIENYKIEPVENYPQMRISEAKLNGKFLPRKLGSNLKEINSFGVYDKVKLRTNSTLHLGVMINEEDLFRRRFYKFIVSGAISKEIITSKPYLDFNFAYPGVYFVDVSCSTRDGSWVPRQPLVRIKVPVPWYQSWWFLSICVLIILFIIRLLFLRAITIRKHRMDDLMREHEQKLREEKKSFLVNISHELRTPLTLIQVHIESIINKEKEKSKVYRTQDTQSIKIINRQIGRMKNLINMVLDVFNADNNEAKLYIYPFKLNTWVQDITTNFIEEAKSKEVDIKFELSPDVGVVSFDPGKCDIIIGNMLINALKQSQKGTEVIINTMRLTDKELGEIVRISVTNQGLGDSTDLGVGISYSQILAKLHGGRIKKQTSTIYLDLPSGSSDKELAERVNDYIDENSHVSDDVEENNDIVDLSQYVILVVDDNKDLTDFFEIALKNNFRKVLIASNGIDALEVIKKTPPDIVVSDVMMPKMNGYELCKRIKEDFTMSHIPVILLTARDDKQSLLSGYKIGADGYLTKPFEIDMLLALIFNRLNMRKVIKEQFMKAGFAINPEDSTFSCTDEKFLLKLNKSINDNISNPKLDVAFLCKEIGMSRASLYNKVKALTDMGTSNYIKKIRMERAVELIVNTDYTFSEISDQLGFNTQRYFSMVFKQYTGMTPSAYREKGDEVCEEEES